MTVSVSLPQGVEEPDGLVDAVLAYETALMSDDVAALDAAFAPGSSTLRGDATGLLVGHDAIAAFRRGRGGAPQRQLLALHVRPVDADNALVVAEVAARRGGRGLQTQLWRRDAELGWVVSAAHVSAPAPAVDARIWRTVGTPLVAPHGDGVLDGVGIAVKDLFEVTGFALGVGNPTFLEAAKPAKRTAPALKALLDAGAHVTGIAQTDEFAYSIAGANAHYGTPPNAAVPGALPGGSSSGPASAVASGQADLGLGTDTAGSIRVPASYQGLWGLRPTHDAVSLDGVWPLAPTFDTVGWLTRDPATLHNAVEATLGATEQRLAPEFVVAPSLRRDLDAEVLEAFDASVARFSPTEVEIPEPDELLTIFRTIQPAEAWKSDGEWVTANPGTLGPGVRERFEIAEGMSATSEAAAREAMAVARERLDSILGDRILLLPSTSSAAPSALASAEELEAVRGATLRLCSVAGVAGRPALSVPVLSATGPTGRPAPLGLCLVGPRGSDLALVELAADLFG